MSTVGSIITGDGCRIAYCLDGPEDAPVLLLSNSLGTALAMWEPQMAALVERFRVLRYDARGHGASAVPPGAYSMDRLGRDVIELIDALQIATIHFCGLSMGGMIGQWLGIRAPQRVDRLILCNTSSFMGPPEGWDDRIKLLPRRPGGLGAIADAVVTRWFTPEFQASALPKVEDILCLLVATDPNGYAGCCAAIRDMDMRPVVALIDRPTLVIGGDADPATPLIDSEALVAAIAGARLVILRAAHLSNWEQPEAFTSAVLDFLA